MCAACPSIFLLYPTFVVIAGICTFLGHSHILRFGVGVSFFVGVGGYSCGWVFLCLFGDFVLFVMARKSVSVRRRRGGGSVRRKRSATSVVMRSRGGMDAVAKPNGTIANKSEITAGWPPFIGDLTPGVNVMVKRSNHQWMYASYIGLDKVNNRLKFDMGNQGTKNIINNQESVNEAGVRVFKLNDKLNYLKRSLEQAEIKIPLLEKIVSTGLPTQIKFLAERITALDTRIKALETNSKSQSKGWF